MYAISTDSGNREYARLNDATKRADKLAEEGGEHKVVHLETEAVVYVTSLAAKAAANGAHFNPWTRVETPKHAAPDFPGFVPAYTRKRIQATVYRGVERGAWRVFDGRTGKYQDVANTVEACNLTSSMRKGLML
jgi:hypothetical protein